MIKPLSKVSGMHPNARIMILNFFRNLVGSGKVTGNLGIEATEDCLESLYDKGYIKILFEPDNSSLIKGRIMLYDAKTKKYDLADALSIVEES